MATVLDFFGIRIQPTSTPIPELGVNNTLNKLQKGSERYFTIGLNAEAGNGSKLAVTIQEGQTFDPANNFHTEYIAHCTLLLKQKLKALKDIDHTIMASITVSVVASTLSFLPLVGYFNWLGWGSALYHLSLRSQANAEYQEALKLSVACCNWSLGPKAEERAHSATPLQNIKEIRDMMVMLYPALTRTQVSHLIADDIEGEFAKELENYEKKFSLPFNTNAMFSATQDQRIALSKKGAEFNRCVYGFNKGSAIDFVDAFVSFLPDLYNAACHGLKRLQHKWQEMTTPVSSHNI